MAAWMLNLGVWKVIDLQDVLLPDILPDVFSDAAKTRAYALADRHMRRMICRYARKVMFYQNLSMLDDAVLDLMAEELKTQYYSASLDRDTKARLIQNTIRWHMLAGTRTAVEELVTSVFESDGVKEWFEYGGDPFYFKIDTELDFSSDLFAVFRDMIKKVKHTAASLEHVALKKSVFLPMQVQCGTAVEESVTILCRNGGE